MICLITMNQFFIQFWLQPFWTFVPDFWSEKSDSKLSELSYRSLFGARLIRSKYADLHPYRFRVSYFLSKTQPNLLIPSLQKHETSSFRANMRKLISIKLWPRRNRSFLWISALVHLTQISGSLHQSALTLPSQLFSRLPHRVPSKSCIGMTFEGKQKISKLIHDDERRAEVKHHLSSAGSSSEMFTHIVGCKTLMSSSLVSQASYKRKTNLRACKKKTEEKIS